MATLTNVISNATGNVGIGTTAPAYKLDVQGITSTARLGNAIVGAFPVSTTFAMFGHNALEHGSTAANYALLQYNDGTTYLNASSTKPIYFRIANADKMILDANGNLGIGTTSPVQKLHVYSSGGGFEFNPGSTCTVESIDRANTAAAVNTAYYTRGTGSFRWHNGSYTERMRIDGGGNVGIGTSTLFAKLVVSNGSGENLEFTPGNATVNGSLIESINRSSGTTRPDLNLFTSGGSNGSIKFYTNGVNERMRIDSNGNVGIGTTSPNNKLTIQEVGTDGTPLIRLITTSAPATFSWFISAMNSSLTAGKNYIGLIGQAESQNNSGYIGFNFQGAGSTSNFLTFGFYQNDNLLNLRASGNVGIGTISPNNKLVVVAGGDVSGINLSYDNTSNNRTGLFAWTRGSSLASLGGGVEYTAASTFTARSTAASYVEFGSGETRFYGNGSLTSGTGFTPTERVTISAIGNVGIGTTSPVAKLEVNGSLYATRLSGSAMFTTNGKGRFYGTASYALASAGGGGGSSLTGQTDSASPYETSLGYQAGNVNTGVANTAVGYQALFSNTTGVNNDAFGYQALYSNISGKGNSAFGFQALKYATTATGNSAFGRSALSQCSGGARNSAFGYYSSGLITGNPAFGGAGMDNCSFGYRSLYFNNSGNNNTAVGKNSLYYNKVSNQTAIGYNALSACTTGNGGNTAVGSSAGSAITFGYRNTMIGNNAGSLGAAPLTTGQNNTCLGNGAITSTATVSNEITLGDSNITSLRCNRTTITSLSDFRDKTDINNVQVGLSFVEKLRPVTFKWDKREWYTDGNRDGSKKDTITQIGFIAQELKALQESENATYLNLVYESNPDKLEATPGNLMVPLIKAVQQLSAIVKQQQIEIDDLKSKVNN